MKRATVKLTFFLVLLITTVSVATPTHWRLLKPGLEYTKISMQSGLHTGYLHAFRIDPSKFALELAIAEDQRNKIASVEDLTLAKKGIIGINGGFFSQELKPLGLRITNHLQRYPLKGTSWWGVFYIVNNMPKITRLKDFSKDGKKIEFAVQSGPRLIVNNQIPHSLKPGIDNRSALGITKANKVILLVTEDLSLTTTQLAKKMNQSEADGGLDCIAALNLDGGSSSQMYAKEGDFSVEVIGYSAVTDAIVVVPRS